MIVPEKAIDDLGQPANAGITFLKYAVELAYVERDKRFGSQGAIELTKEELSHIKIGEASKHIFFRHKPEWRRSAVKGGRRSPYISTGRQNSVVQIKLHQDRGGGREKSGGIPRVFLAKDLPRTVLSTANAAESRTALAVRREMQSWRLLLLEPSALRRPDTFSAPSRLGFDGSHLPATLYRLARTEKSSGESMEAQIYSELSNRLSDLIDDVYKIGIDRDEKRELLTLEVRDRGGTAYSARDLSDGTLRFLATALIELDKEAQGLICLEEPENGIHPSRIPAMLRLLQDIPTDVEDAIGPENPLRQVIVNTHSPAVVQQVHPECLIVAELNEIIHQDRRCKVVKFGYLSDTVRAKMQGSNGIVAKGKLLSYLNPVIRSKKVNRTSPSRVVDRKDIEDLQLFPSKSE